MVIPEISLPGISIKNALVPIELDDFSTRGVLWQSSVARFLLEVPEVARYLVVGGNSITIDSFPDATDQKVKYFMEMLPLAALAYQRGILAFHAAAVTDGDAAVLLAGNSGSGKSTLLAALLQQGWRMLADDLSIVGLDDMLHPIVYPSSPEIALWPHALEKLMFSYESFICCDSNRRRYSVSDFFETKPLPLRGIFHLSVQNKQDIEFEKVSGISRFNALGTILYNSHVADAICNRADYLRCVAAIAQTVPYRYLRRPRGTWSVEAMTDLVVKNFRTIE